MNAVINFVLYCYRSNKREKIRMNRHYRAGKFLSYLRRNNKGSNRGSSTSLESNPGSQVCAFYA